MLLCKCCTTAHSSFQTALLCYMQKISLDFLSFDLEDSPGCTNDRVMVFDGDSASAPLLQTLCGSTVPSNIVSSGAALFVTFETNGLVTKTGFSVNTSEGTQKKTFV